MSQSKYLKATFIRHGSTIFTEHGRLQHDIQGGLSPRGKYEAEATRDVLKKTKFSLAFVADSERARETADIILAYHDMDVRYIKKLRERCCGNLIGKLYEEVRIEHLRHHDPIRFCPDEGESLIDAWERARAEARLLLREDFSGEHILLIGHGTLFKCMLMALENVSPKSIECFCEWGGGFLGNCSITTLIVGWKSGFPTTVKKIYWNDTSHIAI